MKKKNKINISKFEILSQGKESKMIGGFSPSISTQNTLNLTNKNSDCITANNCQGANCARNCGGVPKTF